MQYNSSHVGEFVFLVISLTDQAQKVRHDAVLVHCHAVPGVLAELKEGNRGRPVHLEIARRQVRHQRRHGTRLTEQGSIA